MLVLQRQNMRPWRSLLTLSFFLLTVDLTLISDVEGRPNNRMKARIKTRQRESGGEEQAVATQADAITSAATTTATPTVNYSASSSEDAEKSKGKKSSSYRGKKSGKGCGSVMTGTQSFLVMFVGNPFNVTDIELAIAGGAFVTAYNDLAGVGCNIPMVKSATIELDALQQQQDEQQQEQRTRRKLNEESLEFAATVTAEYTCTGSDCEDFFYSRDADENIGKSGKKDGGSSGKKDGGSSGKKDGSSSKSTKGERRSKDPRILRNRNRTRGRVKNPSSTTNSNTNAHALDETMAGGSENENAESTSPSSETTLSGNGSGKDSGGGRLPTVEEFVRAYDDEIQILAHYNELTNIESALELFELEGTECPDEATYFYTAIDIEHSCDFVDVTEEDLETFEDAFLNTYNNINSLNGRLYDPYFRVIDQVSIVETGTSSVFRYEIRGICNGCARDAAIVDANSEMDAGASSSNHKLHRKLSSNTYSTINAVATTASTTATRLRRHLGEESTCLRPVGAEEEGLPTEEDLEASYNNTINFLQTLDLVQGGNDCIVIGLDQMSLTFIWDQLGEDIVVGETSDLAGTALALSNDGRTMVVGAPESAYVRVLQLNDDTTDTWTQVGEDIISDDNSEELGSAVSISNDGSIVAIGAPGEGSDNQGAYTGLVRVYEYSDVNNVWTQLGQDIHGSAQGDETGFSVALSGDGMTIIIGAPQFVDTDYSGNGRAHVWQFDNSDDNWEQLGQDIEGNTPDGQAGFSVAISDNGYVIAVGEISNSDVLAGAGSVQVFYYDYDVSQNWIQLGQTIYGDEENDGLGFSLSLSASGEILAVAAPQHANDGLSAVGQVRVYQLVQDNHNYEWTQLGQTLYGKGSDNEFGDSLILSANGMILASVGYDSSGYVQVYRYDSSDTNEWIQLAQDVVGEDAAEFITAVSLSSNGYILSYGSSDKGLAKAYQYNPEVDGDIIVESAAATSLPSSSSPDPRGSPITGEASTWRSHETQEGS